MTDTTGIAPALRNADWRRRATDPSVYYANNIGELFAGGLVQTPNPGIITAGGKDIGDGKGMAWVERSDIALSGGACRGMRVVHRLAGGDSNWNFKPYAHMPKGVTRPGRDGVERPVVETRVDPAILTKSKYNPRLLPVMRRSFFQIAFRAERGVLWEKPWYWLSAGQMAEHGAKGARHGLHVNKLFFWTGGQSPDQIATNWHHTTQALKVLFYEGNSSTSSWEPLKTGFLEPDQWYTLEIFIEAQHEGFINDDKSRRSVPGGDPVFVAMWAAKYGDAPELLGYTAPWGEPGPGWIPSRLNDDRNPLINYQDANVDDYSSAGFIVIGPEQGGIDPTPYEFSVAKYAPAHARKLGGAAPCATSRRYYKPDLNQHWNPGRLPNWGAGVALGFTSGALTEDRFVPRHPILDRALTSKELQSYKQAVILRTDYEGHSVVLPNGTSAEVHRVRLEQPLPIAPAAGDCLVIGGRMQKGMGTERMPGFPDARMYHDELIASIDPIDFPHQQGVPLPMPWLR